MASFLLLVCVGLPSVPLICCAEGISSHFAKELSQVEILKHSPVKGGLLVHLGLKTSRLLLEFSKESRFVCQGLTGDPQTRQRLLKELDGKLVYGRCSVVTLNQMGLPYADNLVRILVVEDSCGIIESELWRVLCPGGLLFINTDKGWNAKLKRRSKRMDDWTHARHGADGNFVSKDEYVGEPINARWISKAEYENGSPRATRVIVTSAGRLFIVTGGGARTILRAQDAFSGVELWRRPYPTVKTRRLGHRSYWTFPSLIANGETLFITGQALDASTGKKRYPIDGNPLVCDDNVVVTSSMKAYDASNGEELWQHPQPGIGLTIGDKHLYFIENAWPQKGGPVKLVSLHLATGKLAWRRTFNLPAPDPKRSRYDNYGSSSIPNGLLAGVIYHKGILAVEVTRTYIYLFSAKDGKHLRSLRYKNWSPYASGLRALMIEGKLWLLEAQKDFDFGYNINAYSLTDGKKVASLKLKTPIRQRCRPPLASKKFMFLGGLNTVNLSSGLETVRPIARSLCNFGLVPANGLIYVPPTHCRCYATLKGYIALESLKAGAQLVIANTKDHLIKGSGYRKQMAAAPHSRNEWPQYRQGPMRNAHSESTLPSKLKLLWESPSMGFPISSPVISNNFVVVSEYKSHRLSAFDALTGKWKWSFVAGASIEGPPTISGDYLAFGSKDGWVYALSLSDGELVWKNMAAPAERLIMVHEQLESAWPALGPVVITDNKVIAVAGRHNMAEAGILVTAFDLVSGKKIWQSKTPHRKLINPLTSGVYQKMYDRRRGVTETLPSPSLLGGWLVAKGMSVQIDRLAAFNISNGKGESLFDKRVEQANAARRSSYKNGSRKNDYERWLLSARHNVSRYNSELAPKNTVAIASSKKRWVVLTDRDLILIDDNKDETFRIPLGQHKPTAHGIAVAKGKIFITTQKGRILCFGS